MEEESLSIKRDSKREMGLERTSGLQPLYRKASVIKLVQEDKKTRFLPESKEVTLWGGRQLSSEKAYDKIWVTFR